MTNGSSQGLFVIVAVVIFGIFVVISYLLFRDKLQISLASIFQDGVTNTMSSDSFFNNTIKEKEYISTYNKGYEEFVNSEDWDVTPIIDYFGTEKQYKVSFEAKATKSDTNTLFYVQSGSGGKYTTDTLTINGKIGNKISIDTSYQKYEIIVKFKLRNVNTEKGEINYENSLLAVWGGSSYISEVIPTVKNMTVEVIK